MKAIDLGKGPISDRYHPFPNYRRNRPNEERGTMPPGRGLAIQRAKGGKPALVQTARRGVKARERARFRLAYGVRMRSGQV